MTEPIDSQVAIVTGGGRGIGRATAEALACAGFAVVVNDLGVSQDGSSANSTPARDVVATIRSRGGQAVSNGCDVSDWDAAGALIDNALENFGRVDLLVNNAGILRDRTIVNMTASEWDDVLRVHLRGTAATTHHAAAYWRKRTKSGGAIDARVINTTSSSGLYASPGQSNYAAAKAGIAAFSQVAAKELARYGVAVNAIAPTALTRMTEQAADLIPDYPPERIGAFIVWLASCQPVVSGQVFNIGGQHVSIADSWRRGAGSDDVTGWSIRDLDALVPSLIAESGGPVDGLGRPLRSTAAASGIETDRRDS